MEKQMNQEVPTDTIPSGEADPPQEWTCCLYGKPCRSWRDNPAPLVEGRCCDDCNREEVIPVRMKLPDEATEAGCRGESAGSRKEPIS